MYMYILLSHKFAHIHTTCVYIYYVYVLHSTEFRQKLLADTFELDVIDEERLTTTVTTNIQLGP